MEFPGNPGVLGSSGHGEVHAVPGEHARGGGLGERLPSAGGGGGFPVMEEALGVAGDLES
jgi:hypothetical protein